MLTSHGLNSFRPEADFGRFYSICRNRFVSPCFGDNVWQQEHRHIATHAITLIRDVMQDLPLDVMKFFAAVVELQSVNPSAVIRIPAVRQYSRSVLRHDLNIVLRLSFEIGFTPVYVVLRMFQDPRMIRSRMIRNEIGHESNAALSKPFPKVRQRGPATKIRMNFIGANGKWRPANIRLFQIRKILLALLAPDRIGS